jgi:UPF0042 nucleotide-binding protein
MAGNANGSVDHAGGNDQLVVVSGLSGSGKTVALRTLEDLGYYCVDNLPAALMPAFVQAIAQSTGGHHRLAVGVDVRNRAENLNRLPQILAELARSDIGYRLVFLDTRDDVLIKRYSETRRRHPLSGEGLGLAEAIAEERRLLKPMLALADRVVDTSDLNVHQLRKAVLARVAPEHNARVSLLFESFAYRRGLPGDADFVFDARCLPNPHWDPRLRPLSGRDVAVREHLDAQDTVRDYVGQVEAFLDTWMPRFESESRSYVTIAFGCTGGRHRSVYLAEKLAQHFRDAGREDVLTFHRELE